MSRYSVGFIRQQIRSQYGWLVYLRARNKRTIPNDRDKRIDTFADFMSGFFHHKNKRYALKMAFFSNRLAEDLATFRNEPLENIIARMSPIANNHESLKRFGIKSCSG